MPNAITMLKADHANVRRLMRELSDTTSRATKQRERLVAENERELKIHSQLEEEIFYPAFKAAVKGNEEGEDLFYEANEEHHVVDMVLPTLKADPKKSKEFEAKVKVLQDLLDHHIREEETEMFPQARQSMGEARLREIGDEMQARKEILMSEWNHPLLRPVKKLQSAAHKLLPLKAKTAKGNAIAKAREQRGDAR